MLGFYRHKVPFRALFALVFALSAFHCEPPEEHIALVPLAKVDKKKMQFCDSCMAKIIDGKLFELAIEEEEETDCE